jgi:hypothetical protein
VQQRAKQFHGSGISPVEVVKNEYERLRRPEQLEQLTDGAVSPIALVLERCPITVASERGNRGKDAGELGADVPVHGMETVRLESLNVLVECVHEDPKRQITLELRGGSGEDELLTSVGADGELGEKARLADTGLADDFDRRRQPSIELGEDVIERREFRRASH